jgi:hypothetical protein
MGKLFEIPNLDRLIKSDQEVQAEQQAELKQQIQMMILEAMLNTESKTRLAQENARLKPKPAGQGAGGGRPAKAQFEGKIPGAGLTSPIRDIAQAMGAGSLGLEGMGETGGS